MSSPTMPRALIDVAYEEYARQYLRSLPLSHFMESVDQANQRRITVESLDLVKARRSDFQVYSELLVQYPRKGQERPGHVVPDNMVVVSDEPLTAELSFKTPLQPVGPFWVMEYVSKRNKRKDYETNFKIYERDLKVPYYLIFYPDTQDLTLYRHTGKKYVSVKPNEHGRYAVPELEIEVALLDGWVRFWYQGELLPLPADMQRELDAMRQQTEDLKRHLADSEKARRAAEEEVTRLRAQLEKRDKKGRR
jgi:Uma2 family endonuclease